MASGVRKNVLIVDDRTRAAPRTPAILLATDTNLRLVTALAPSAVSKLLNAARKTGCGIDSLAWEDPKRVAEALKGALRGRNQRISWQLGATRFDGHVMPHWDEAGHVRGTIVVGFDTAEVAAMHAELHELRHALGQAREENSFAYYTVDVSTGIATITAAFARIWGFPDDAGKVHFGKLEERVHELDRAAFARLRHETNDSSDPLSLTYRIVRPDGEIRHLRTFVSYFTDPHGRVERSVGTVIDVTEHVAAQDAVTYLTSHDGLTQALNRQALIDLLEQYTAKNVSDSVSLVAIDIDRFAQINDIAGHAAGDQLLRILAARLQFIERNGHFVARIGSDEFACLLVNVADASEREGLIETIRQRLSLPYTIEQNEYVVRTTMGVATHPEDGSGTLLLQNANIALLSAKATARGSVAHYHPSLERKLGARSRIAHDLTTAVERRQFEMYYQPLIDAVSGKVIAAEALLRWEHPDLGLLTPDVFLGIAEESDVVVNIGRWVIERACRDAVKLSESVGRKLRINVNVSPRHVQSMALVNDVASALDASGWDPGHLQLEVTEQVLIEDVPSAVTTLERLRDNGISIAIDDFGTGYNTLTYLKSYPVSCIKIDRAFVKDAEVDDYSRAICLSVKALAESLRMNLIGEGVETPGQAKFLRNLGCNELQGYHFGYPVPVKEFINMHGNDGFWYTEAARA